MNDTLQRIKRRIDSEVNYLNEFHIMTDNTIPTIAGYPAVGLKDGDEEWDLVGGTLADGAEFDKGMIVKIIVFQQMFRDDDSVITGDCKEKGILKIALDVITALNGWKFGDDEAEYSSPIIIRRSKESQTYASVSDEDELDEVYIQQKELIFSTARQVTI